MRRGVPRQDPVGQVVEDEVPVIEAHNDDNMSRALLRDGERDEKTARWPAKINELLALGEGVILAVSAWHARIPAVLAARRIDIETIGYTSGLSP